MSFADGALDLENSESNADAGHDQVRADINWVLKDQEEIVCFSAVITQTTDSFQINHGMHLGEVAMVVPIYSTGQMLPNMMFGHEILLDQLRMEKMEQLTLLAAQDLPYTHKSFFLIIQPDYSWIVCFVTSMAAELTTRRNVR